MTYCRLCEKESVENWFGNFCYNCRKIKNLGNVYGFDRILEILRKCCIRDESQLENKIKNHKERLSTIPESTESTEEIESKLNDSDESYEKPKTRAKKTK